MWSWDEINDREKKEQVCFTIILYCGVIYKVFPHNLLWSSISVQHEPSCIWVIVILLPHFNPRSSSGFTVKLSAQVLVKYNFLMPKPLRNSTVSESACIAAFRSTGTFFLIIYFVLFWGCLLLPSRGNPAPVHDSGLPDRHDRTPSRMACSSENRKTK